MRWILPAVFLAISSVCIGFGGQRVVHMARAARALAGDYGCRHTLELTTPPSQSAGCRIVPGRIVRAYEREAGTQYHGGIAYDQYLVYAPSGGGPATEFRMERFYAPQTQPEPGPAVAEYVDGEVDYVTSASARIGPAFDPASDAILGWCLLGLGAFFLLTGGGYAAFSAVRGSGSRGPRRARS